MKCPECDMEMPEETCVEEASELLADLEEKGAPEDVVKDATALRDKISAWYDKSDASKEDYSAMDSKSKEKSLKSKGIIITFGSDEE